MNKVVKGFFARGKCQNVMFRQTIVRGMISHGLEGGASNSDKDKQLVHITLHGDSETIDTFVNKLKTTKPLNSWGASLNDLEENPNPISMEEHQVTTNNVDNFKWNKNVEFYLQ
ncbi:hypothetical protein ABK040_004081 [Willaertia magna]